MKIFSFLFSKLETAGLAILAILSLFLLGRNSRLSKKNKALNNINTNQNKTIEIQKKVINVAKNTKSVDVSGNIERMRQDKL
jgi:hypothetical protein